uniref:EF-hand domain-containing protein n=1 Tax=Panagrellus redivivus TaxID=6233 RepID=A0A7E4W6U5_PANRE
MKASAEKSRAQFRVLEFQQRLRSGRVHDDSNHVRIYISTFDFDGEGSLERHGYNSALIRAQREAIREQTAPSLQATAPSRSVLAGGGDDDDMRQ